MSPLLPSSSCTESIQIEEPRPPNQQNPKDASYFPVLSTFFWLGTGMASSRREVTMDQRPWVHTVYVALGTCGTQSA